MTIITISESVRRELEAAEISPGILDNCLNSKFLSVKYDADAGSV